MCAVKGEDTVGRFLDFYKVPEDHRKQAPQKKMMD